MVLIYIFILLLILLILSAVLIGINQLKGLKKGGGTIINDDNALSYIKDGVLTIPSDVIEITTERYINNSDIISIQFVQPSKLNRILSYTFENCANLTDIAIPISVTNIGIKAFKNCPKLKNIILPKIFTNELSFIFDKIMPIITFIEPEPKSAYVRPSPAYVGPTIDDKILEIALTVPLPSNGLIIHNTIIQKLSGPISFYYLKPDYNRIAKEDIKKHPLIILFGDEHRSFDHICDPCDISNGCYRLDSPEFLQVIDSLAMMVPSSAAIDEDELSVSIDEPSAAIKSDFYIDWFIENSFYGMGNGFKNGPMGYFTNFSRSNNISACYDRSLIGTKEYAKKCPTKNIRWHHGDLRYFGDIYDRRFTLDLKTKYYTAENQPFEIAFKNSIDYYFSKLQKNVPLSSLNIKTEDSNGNRIFTLIEFKEILSHLIVDDSFNLHNFLTYYFDRVFSTDNPKSILWKEMYKQSINYFTGIDNWIDFYLNFITETLKHKFKYILYDIKSVLNETPNTWHSSSSQLVFFFIHISSILIEMYTILRIFKINSNDDGQHNQSALSLVYMGDSHIINIKNIILNLAPYTLVESIIGEGDNLRCLDFSSFKLDLTEELKKHRFLSRVNKLY
uniref:Uncharacterized protein n=1 Tax=viral metagenome TaxID=1070528 RepID=A0A6C0I0D9_9ZZZZ